MTQESMERMIRRIVREELKGAFEALAASASACDIPYETDRADSAAFDAIRQAAERAAGVMVHIKECPCRTARWDDTCLCWQEGVDPTASADEG